MKNSKIKTVIGKCKLNKRGFGFVDLRGEKSIFIPPPYINGAMDNDTVEVKLFKTFSQKGPEGEVIKIIKRASKELFGVVVNKEEYENNIYYQVYCPSLIKEEYLHIKEKSKKLEHGDRIIVSITNWEHLNAEFKSFIGNIENPKLDDISSLKRFKIRDEFDEKVLSEIKNLPKNPTNKDLKNRIDFTKLNCITIDPTTAKDFDDAISIKKDSNGGYELGVHIADVAHYVKANTALDKEAFKRSNSTYFPTRCVPMLPEALSSNLCSLKPNVIRLTMSVIMHFDKNANLKSYEIKRSYIKSRKRFTYDEAFDILENDKSHRYYDQLKDLLDIGMLLKKRRIDRNSFDFAIPETKLDVDEDGNVKRIYKTQYDVTHQIIEEFMLKANEIVATHLKKKVKTLIYRIHDQPNVEKFKDFFALAGMLGFTTKSNEKEDIINIFNQAKNSPLLKQLQVSFIRCMKLAIYSPENVGHYGLSLENYTHFTSPIRRYPDLIIQRLLFNEISANPDLPNQDLSETYFEKIASSCSENERRSFNAEQSIIVLKKLRFLKDKQKKLGDEPLYANGIITKINPHAIFIDIDDYGLESVISIDDLNRIDKFYYNEGKRCIESKYNNFSLKISDTVEIKLDKVDLIHTEAVWLVDDYITNKIKSSGKKKPLEDGKNKFYKTSNFSKKLKNRKSSSKLKKEKEKTPKSKRSRRRKK
jgi:ribonuclease R